MNNLIYIVIGLAIILIVAIVLMRKKKTPEVGRPTAPPNASRPAGNAAAASQVAHQADTPVPAPTAPSSQEHLNHAQQFIDQQRYDDAIGELKQGLVTYPNDKDLSLKLLNVYAISNRQSDFDSLSLRLND